MMDYFSGPYRFPPKKSERFVFGLVFFIVGLGIFFSHYHPSYFEVSWVRGNGWVESFTVLGMILLVLINVYRANILYPFRGNLFIVCTWLMALGFFFGLGEKISWGQHIFDFQPSNFFVRFNIYGEANLHHLKFGDWWMGKMVFDYFAKPMMIVYFLVLPLLYGKWTLAKSFVDGLALPLPRLYHLLAYALLFLLCEGIAGGRKKEILEFGGFWILFLMFCRPYNRQLFSRVSFNR